MQEEERQPVFYVPVESITILFQVLLIVALPKKARIVVVGIAVETLHVKRLSHDNHRVQCRAQGEAIEQKRPPQRRRDGGDD